MGKDTKRCFRDGTKVLDITIGEESRAKESRIGRRDSLLYECYLKSFEVMGETIEHAKRYYQSPVGHSLDNYYTNVIVFDGARGRGKTSAMLTFGRALEGLNALGSAAAYDRPRVLGEVFDRPDSELIRAVESLEDSNFLVLPPIDPTVLIKSHDLLTTFTARLYQMAQQWWEQGQRAQSSDSGRGFDSAGSFYGKKDNFLKDIKECYVAISALMDNKDKKDVSAWSMAQLGKMGAASELSKYFQRAVCSLLDLYGMNPASSFVILQIDDADMTFTNVYEILEDLRCFLKIPNLIVLMAADLTMIESLVRQSFIKQTPDDDEDLAQELTEQYMIKYFPLRRQIALPDLNDVLHHNVQRVGMRVWTDRGRKEDFFSELYDTNDAGEQQDALCMSTSLLRMLFRRTGILLDDTKGYYPWLLPVSQRGLAGFVGLLHKMKPVKRLKKLDELFVQERVAMEQETPFTFYYPCSSLDASISEYVNDLENWLSNVRLLECYFLHDWTLAALTRGEYVQFRKIARASVWDKRGRTYKALEALGVKDLDFEDSKDFMSLVTTLRTYKKQHGPSFSYAVRVQESLFAQEYILETLQRHFSKGGSEKPNEEARGDYYTSFPGLKSFYSGKMALEESHSTVAEGLWKRDLEYRRKHEPYTLNSDAIPKERDGLVGDAPEERRFKSYVFLFDVKPDEEGDINLRMDAPLFSSLYIGAGDSEVKHNSLHEINDRDFLGSLLPLQDLMLFLASNWDAMRNVIKRLRHWNDFNVSEVSNLDLFRLWTRSLYRYAVSGLSGTIPPVVCDQVGSRATSWFRDSPKLDYVPTGRTPAMRQHNDSD